MSTKLAWVLNTEGLSSDRPPNRDICSCTSASNGHVYYDGHNSSSPSWIVVPLRELNRYQCGGRGGGACESKLAVYRLDTPQAEERKPVAKSFDMGGMGSDRRTGSPKSAGRLQSDRWSLVTDRHWEMKRDAFLHPISKMLDVA
ncbi:hypothetical protein TNCV_2547341 [Trichonephila clavipes]|nr:hypothetical protein TNCV_2547341 [Trichonephila clavipes]